MGRARVCLVSPGQSVHTKRWGEALQHRGYEVMLVTMEDALRQSVPVFNPYTAMGRLRVPKLHYLVAYLLVRRAISRFSPDIVHMHFLDVSPFMISLAGHWPKFVVSVWGRDVVWDAPTPEPRRRIRRNRKLLALADEITATTEFLAQKIAPLVPPSRRVTVIPFGVDTEVFVPPPDRPPVAPVIGFAKHYAAKYGPDVLLRSLVEVRRLCPDVRLVMAGDRDREPYRRLAHDLGVLDAVQLEGPVPYEDMPALMRSFDVFCMPSVYESETFGVAAVEASATAVPVVASRVGGVEHAVIHGETGLLVRPGDPGELAAALIRLLMDRSLARQMGAAGRRFVLERYRWSASVEAMEDVYARTLHDRTDASRAA